MLSTGINDLFPIRSTVCLFRRCHYKYVLVYPTSRGEELDTFQTVDII